MGLEVETADICQTCALQKLGHQCHRYREGEILSPVACCIGLGRTVIEDVGPGRCGVACQGGDGHWGVRDTLGMRVYETRGLQATESRVLVS